MKSIAQYRADLAACREALFCIDGIRSAPIEAIRAYTGKVDSVLKDIHESTISPASPGTKVCLIALGGYGRRELCPYSDVDLLVLHDNGSAKDAIASAVRHFWDVGLNMGCVVRTLRDCAAILGDDFATDTALLESRYLAGDKGLYDKLQQTVLAPYFEKQKNTYLSDIVRTLQEGLYSPEKSIYRVEPYLKDGPCCLRDCQRLLWAEHIRNDASTFKDLHLKAGFTATQASRLETDYTFLLKLRMALHMVCGHRLDVLETALQPIVAETCGYGSQGAGIMMEQFYRTVRRIRLMLLSFLERDLTGRNIWRDVRRRLSANPICPGIAVLDGIMFSIKSDDERIGTPLWLMDVFKQTLVHRATLSVELRNRLRHFLSHSEKKAFRSQAVGDAFRDILTSREPIGRTLQMMHETRLLERLIPQFHPLTCKVEYHSYHEYTLDQHILLTLQTIDDMVSDTDKNIRDLYIGLKRPFILRMALLLHDIGKTQDGDHAQSGAVMAENICERLGIAEEESERIRFLVLHHLDMSYLSLQREPEDHNIVQFANMLGDKEALDMLYLLTIADIRSVGSRTWTQWKAYQLEQLYERTLSALENSPSIISQPVLQKLSSEDAEPIIVDSSYQQGTSQAERRQHAQWLASVDDTDMLLHYEPFSGFERLTVCGHDRIGFFSNMIGCLYSEGYNILSARVYSTTDGKVLDIFNLEPPAKPRLTAAIRIQNIYKKWRLLSGGETTANALVNERLRKYPPDPLRTISPPPPVKVLVDNISSPLHTIVEIDTPDNFGLLYKIAHCFSERKINIVSARLSTRVDQAVDVFYINDGEKQKITKVDQIDSLKEILLSTLSV
ncbi:MAG: Bifunctional uridylyltransferase/uridylyl-removing enzyme [Syntrophus sp. SKADARSKE-3]|nr:Bifunctional uridylyltransferase/uridylyl-removing enzyme [Syntrophus sp. SKADARSKE-3]